MAKYINVDSLYERLEKRYRQIVENYSDLDAQHYIMGFREAINCLKNEPAADVQEVKHAKDLQSEREFSSWTFECSRCHFFDDDTYCIDSQIGSIKYCPNCGAKMDLEDDK